MAYLFEEKVRQRAAEYIEALARAGINGTIIADSFRDYTVKVAVARGSRAFGHVNLYYSPKKNVFSLKMHELRDKSIAPELEMCWEPQGIALPGQAMSAPPIGLHAYVDGSWQAGAIGYGVVLVQDGGEIAAWSDVITDPAVQSLRQVVGELQAVRDVIEWCKNNRVASVTIFYDYEGIEKWPTGQWQAKAAVTQQYASFVKGCGIDIKWQKVKSHTGNKWNERADQLAKQGAAKGRPSGASQEPVANDWIAKAESFVDFLKDRGIDASYTGVFNNQYARLIIRPRGIDARFRKSSGTVDIYNTRKRSPSDPYLHGFQNTDSQTQIRLFWAEHFDGRVRSEEEAGDGAKAKEPDVLQEASYYYAILEPYRNFNFDFVALAESINRANEALHMPLLDVKRTRFDFLELEKAYHRLRDRSHA